MFPIPPGLQAILDDLFEDLKTIFEIHLKTIVENSGVYKEWVSGREAAISELTRALTDLAEHHKNVSIANLAGSSVNLVSGAACIGGILMAPFTAGVSLALSAGGVIGTVAGTTAAIGSDITEHFLKKDVLEKAEDALNKDQKNTLKLISLVESCMKIPIKVTEHIRIKYSIAFASYSSILNIILDEESDEFERIMKGIGLFVDYAHLLAVSSDKNCFMFEQLKKMMSFQTPTSVECKDKFVIFSLSSSISKVMQCEKVLSSIKTGSVVFRAASVVPRVTASAFIGITMVPDLVNIVMRATSMNDETSEMKSIRELIETLEDQKNIADFFRKEFAK